MAAAIGQAPLCTRAAPAGAATLPSGLTPRVPNRRPALRRDIPRSRLGDRPGGSAASGLAGRVAGVVVGRRSRARRGTPAWLTIRGEGSGGAVMQQATKRGFLVESGE